MLTLPTPSMAIANILYLICQCFCKEVAQCPNPSYKIQLCMQPRDLKIHTYSYSNGKNKKQNRYKRIDQVLGIISEERRVEKNQNNKMMVSGQQGSDTYEATAVVAVSTLPLQAEARQNTKSQGRRRCGIQPLAEKLLATGSS